MHGPTTMRTCLRILSILAFATVLFPPNAVSEHCFRNREARGRLGSCDDEINLQGDSTKEACCAAGGAGWTVKASGKRCEDACEGEVNEPELDPDQPEEEEEIDQNEEITDQPKVIGEERYCFRTREPRGALGSCEELIGMKTKEGCCRHGGKGWTEKASGKRCEDTCLDVVDPGPVGHCFSTLSERQRGNRCSDSIGEMGKIQCCQDEGNGWSESSDGRRCVVPCEQDPVDGGWSRWSEYSPCSVTCGEGEQSRTRTCDNPTPAHGGADCEGDTVEVAICDEGPCPIHGGWGNWGRTGPCSETCQSAGSPVYKQQRRQCNNPAPQFGGRPCKGASSRRIRCISLPFCPIDGGWSDWSDWSDCSQTCEDGFKVRVRRCDNPAPQHGGQNCTGDTRDTTDCHNRRKCPIHGGWSDWGDWTECDAPRCGIDGKRLRSRTCTNPSPKYQGRYCDGNIIDTETCSVCPEWTEWGRWRPCTNGCKRNSVRFRTRKCEGIGRCEGPYLQTGSCRELDPCPDEDDGSGSGSGSGSGEEDYDYLCDDEDDCNGDPAESYSYWEPPEDSSGPDKPDKPEPEPSDPCDFYDYSLDYLVDCNNVPVDPVDPVAPVGPVGPVAPVEEDDYSYSDGDIAPDNNVPDNNVPDNNIALYDSYSYDDVPPVGESPADPPEEMDEDYSISYV